MCIDFSINDLHFRESRATNNLSGRMAGLVRSLVSRSVKLPGLTRLQSGIQSGRVAQLAGVDFPAVRLGSAWLHRVIAPGTEALARWCHHASSGQNAEQEIYNGILSTQIKMVKTFSLTTTCIGLAFQPILWNCSTANAAVVLGTGVFLGIFTFATPLLIHSFSKKYVTKLYYNQVEDKYTAVVYNIFVRPKKIEFKVTDVEVPQIPGMFTTFKANSVPLFVEGSQFTDITHYGKIMGYEEKPWEGLSAERDRRD